MRRGKIKRKPRKRKRKVKIIWGSLFWKVLSVSLLIYIAFLKMPEIKSMVSSKPILKISPKKDTKDILKKVLVEEKQYNGRVALVMDDMGLSLSKFEKALKISLPITFAILPQRRYSSDIYQAADKLGYETIMHLPMEPENSEKNAGIGKITTKMKKQEIIDVLNNDLSQFDSIVGVNNHMGSKATQDSRIMKIVLSELKKKGKFFLDSVTSSRSVGYSLAKEIGLKRAKRDVFLDNNDNVEYIEQQIEKLIVKARKKKNAIGIGHPHDNTIKALINKRNRFEEEGLELVFLSEMVLK